MPFSLLSGMIGAGVQTANNYANRRWQSEEAEKARQYNTQMMEMAQQYNTAEREAAQQFNIDMWNMNNEYNDPSNQLARATAAGINPNAVIGNGGMSPAQSSPVTTSPQSSGAASTGPATMPSQFDVGSTLANSASNYWSNQLLMRQATGQDIDNQWKSKLNKAQYEKTVSECTKLGIDADKVRADINALEQLTPKQVKLVAAQIDSIRQQISESEANIEKINAEKDKVEADTAFTQAQTTNVEKQGAKLDREITLLDGQIVQQGYDIYINQLKTELAKNGILLDTDMLGRLLFAEDFAEKSRGDLLKDPEYKAVSDKARSGEITLGEFNDEAQDIMDARDKRRRTPDKIKRISSEYADAILGSLGRESARQDIDLSEEYARQGRSRIGIEALDHFVNWAATFFKDGPSKSSKNK